MGTRDYVRKNGFQKVVLGLNGGIDSALVACIAVEALGSENVITVAMPSEYSSPQSVTDAQVLANNLGIEFRVIPIQSVFQEYKNTLADTFENLPEDITEENIQARIRGNLLMALSNKFGWLVLACGNKSEVAVGYCTLYGDMVGGFSPLKDVPKIMVYSLASFINKKEGREKIPLAILEKAPSAELKPDQTDQDTLPPYEILDAVMNMYLEQQKSIQQIHEAGYEREVVEKIIRLIKTNEYKRRQGAPGIKITPKAFTNDRRIPITNGYIESE